jgi:hypothetical protein
MSREKGRHGVEMIDRQQRQGLWYKDKDCNLTLLYMFIETDARAVLGSKHSGLKRTYRVMPLQERTWRSLPLDLIHLRTTDLGYVYGDRNLLEDSLSLAKSPQPSRCSLLQVRVSSDRNLRTTLTASLCLRQGCNSVIPLQQIPQDRSRG